MKILKIEPFSGISGDMMLGALVDLGASKELLTDLPRILGFSDVAISIAQVQKCGISCTKVNIVDNTEPVARHLHHIIDIIEKADIPAEAREFAGRVFTLVGQAEAKVHSTSIENVHFHEVGAVDSIMDIVGAALLLDEFDFSAVVASPICTGSGFVHCAHGRLPVPAPATELILQGMPAYPGDIAKEMTTPTGAAILKALKPDFKIPVMNIGVSGYGAGDRDLEQPNCLRIGLGEPVSSDGSSSEQVCVIQTNIDDTSGELLGDHFQNLLLAGGALDINLSAVMMKKGRPGQRLEVLCLKDDLHKLSDIILNETTTIGVRHWVANRIVLTRSYEMVETKYGKIRLKCVSLPNGGLRKTPEYEDCRKWAVEARVPVQEVMREALRMCY